MFRLIGQGFKTRQIAEELHHLDQDRGVGTAHPIKDKLKLDTEARTS